MTIAATPSDLTSELSELYLGSVSLFRMLPTFRVGMTCPDRQRLLSDIEAAVGEHLAHLDRILTMIPIDLRGADGEVARMLSEALSTVQNDWPSDARDVAILQAVQQVQLFLLGSCGFAIRCARAAGWCDVAAILEASMRKMRGAGLPVLLGASERERQRATASWAG
jgi:ferritin-like metal-binding protein YciE